MSRRTLVLIILLTLITAGLLVLALRPSVPPAPIKPQTAPVAQTSLSFGQVIITPATTSASPTYSLPVNIKTGANKVTVVQLELVFDPELLENVTATPGSFFTNSIELLKAIDAKNGKITYAIAVAPTDNGKEGIGTVAIISFESKAETQTETAITFSPKSLVAAEGFAQSVLISTNSAQFSLSPLTP